MKILKSVSIQKNGIYFPHVFEGKKNNIKEAADKSQERKEPHNQVKKKKT